MKRTIKLAVVAALALSATSAFATNGTSLIGYGAKSRAMGGTAVSNYLGAESAFANPALISNVKDVEVTIGATLLMPDVSFKVDNAPATGIPTGNYSSIAGNGMVPSVASVNKVNDSFAWGLALYGVGGMGVDYRDEAMLGGAANAPSDNLLLMRLSLPLAYNINGFSIGIAPVIEYGSLSMGTDSGVTTDLATGFEVGMSYSIAGFGLGLDYKSAVTHDFKHTFNSDMTGAGTQSKLDTPAAMTLGVSYKISNSTIAFDYKTIYNSSAKGFKDFGWEDQTVMALGYEYATTNWALRAGYNYGESPLPTTITDPISFQQVMGSLMMFPAVTESHITLGGTYNFSQRVSVDLAYMIAEGSASATIPAAMGGGTLEATNDQTAVSFALNYTY